LGLQVRIGDPG
jgi:hypothetical protein